MAGLQRPSTVEVYGAKYTKAVECLTKDRNALLTFYDFPAEHWKHLRKGPLCAESAPTRRFDPHPTITHPTHTKPTAHATCGIALGVEGNGDLATGSQLRLPHPPRGDRASRPGFCARPARGGAGMGRVCGQPGRLNVEAGGGRLYSLEPRFTECVSCDTWY